MTGKNYFEEIGAWPRSHSIVGAYVVGFVLSLILTFVAYFMVTQDVFPYVWLIAAIMLAAVLQSVVQVYCFLHIGPDRSSRERLFALGFAGLIILILVAGSLWIMFSLNSRMMPDQQQMGQYMSDQTGF